MKKFIYIFFCICLLVMNSLPVWSQTCSSDFTVDTEIKNSTCQSNGEITITLSGETTNLSSIQYGLSSSSGFTINPQSDNVLRNIPPGTYTLTVRAFCQIDNDYNVVKSVTNLVVGGNYQATEVSFNANVSRKSYTSCNTGIIALNVTNGGGTFTFTITSAPAGITTPLVVTPTKSGDVYTFPESNYPAGDYTVQINDGCYTASTSFTLLSVSGFPELTNKASTAFTPFIDNSGSSCSYVYFSTASSQLNTNSDYLRYYNDGLYEIGVAPVGNMPTNWQAWNSSGNMLLDLSPSNISNFYTANSLTVYTRLKGCESTYTSFNTNLSSPVIQNPLRTQTCTNYQTYLFLYNNSTGIVCYPLSLTVTNNSTNTVVHSVENWTADTNANDVITLDYNINYTIKFIDKNGTEITKVIKQESKREYIQGSVSTSCDNYTFNYRIFVTGKPENCWTWPVAVTITDPEGTVVGQQSITDSKTVTSPALKYGVTYTITVNFPGEESKTYTIMQAAPAAPEYSFSTYSSYDDKCVRNKSALYVYSTQAIPAGSTFSVTGPAGYTSQTVVKDTPSASNTIFFPTTILPPGTYTLTATGCGTPVEVPYTHRGVYDVQNFSYNSEQTCSGLKITPTGYITYRGFAYSSLTYFRLLSGPSGYETNVVGLGGSFTLSTPGTYKLAILAQNSATACALDSVTITYTQSPLALNPNVTLSYVCVGETVGNIAVKAINGVAPYTYELWDKTNTVKQDVANITTSGTAHFTYGDGNQSYTIRITDQCGNSFNQQITMTKLSEAKIVYVTENNLCDGSTIKLHCITLGETVYNWTGPNNFSSTDQNPTITNATNLMSGWYKVSVTPEFCGTPVLDSIYVTVYPVLTAGSIDASQEVCIRAIPSALVSNTTGGSGVYTYQWQSSVDGTNWVDIQDATTDTYQPSAEIISGVVRYYRKITYNKCGTVYSDPITLTTKVCYIPVNPNLRNRGYKK